MSRNSGFYAIMHNGLTINWYSCFSTGQQHGGKGEREAAGQRLKRTYRVPPV